MEILAVFAIECKKVKNFGYSWRNFALYMWRHKNDTAGV